MDRAEAKTKVKCVGIMGGVKKTNLPLNTALHFNVNVMNNKV